MSLRYHEIAEANHRILNPFTHDKLMLLGEVCRLAPDMRQLDLACGKAEMLCQWARQWGISGVGVDISREFLAAARHRATELGVAAQVTLFEKEAGQYLVEAAESLQQSANDTRFDIVSCIGATWIGGGLPGTLRLMLPALKDDGLLLVGEPFWSEPPPDEAYAAMSIGQDDYTSLAGTLERFESAGLELVEMVLADQNSWDRYVAAQWWTIFDWLRAHPNDPDAANLREWNAKWRQIYLKYNRRYFGWGVFVLKPLNPSTVP